MINTEMRTYDYFTFGDSNGYGQPQLSKEPTGTIKISIYTTSQSVQDNINYSKANYIGLTLNKSVNDTFVVQYGNQQLKVLYVQPKGKYIQVFMQSI